MLLDLDTGKELTFALADVYQHITAFMPGCKVSFETQAAVTINVAELMGKLHDALEASGYLDMIWSNCSFGALRHRSRPVGAFVRARCEALVDPLAREAGKQNRRVNRAAARSLK